MKIQSDSLWSSVLKRKSSIWNFTKNLLTALLIFSIGTLFGASTSNAFHRDQARKTRPIFPASYSGVSVVTYATGTALYALEPYTQCGDSPRYSCEGSLYEINRGKFKQVANNVIGHNLIYYEPGVRALLSEGYGDGSCRDMKFYIYDFLTATSTLTFSATNNCNEFEYDSYKKAVGDYLLQFGLQ